MIAFRYQLAVVVFILVAVSCSRRASDHATSAKSGSETTPAIGSPARAVQTAAGSSASAALMAFSNLDKVYQDQSHCLTAADMRGDRDMPISCWCRDAIVDWRYVYFTYVLPGKDRNLNGTLLALEQRIRQVCGQRYDVLEAAGGENWRWNGPEVVRTYPADGVILRISPESRNGKTVGRWVPFTVQLVYRDDQGRITRTENYSSREFVPITK